MVICEGAGSPAEINLRDTDIANMGLARAAGLPVIVVGDIDRGGVLAALYGTLALLAPADQALVGGFVVNKFRGDPGCSQPGLDMLRRLTGRPVLGVLPWRRGLWLDAEDSLEPRTAGPGRRHRCGRRVLRVAVIRLPGSATSPTWTRWPPSRACWSGSPPPAELADADLVVLPGNAGHRGRPGLAA